MSITIHEEGSMDTTVKTPITREGLIEKLIEYRSEQWDHDDTVEMLEYGRTGFVEMTNEVLEEIAIDYMLEEDGVEAVYHITDADPSKPSAEEINKEMLDELRDIARRIDRDSGSPRFTAKQHDRLVALIAKAEGR